jgi:hypothetical protein
MQSSSICNFQVEAGQKNPKPVAGIHVLAIGRRSKNPDYGIYKENNFPLSHIHS